MCVLSVSTAVSHTQLSECEVATLSEQVNKKMKASEGALETLKVRLEKEEQELQNKVDGFRLVTTGCTFILYIIRRIFTVDPRVTTGLTYDQLRLRLKFLF
jgi:hypothetical protein